MREVFRAHEHRNGVLFSNIIRKLQRKLRKGRGSCGVIQTYSKPRSWARTPPCTPMFYLLGELPSDISGPRGHLVWSEGICMKYLL